jgi:hypothetical protein
VSKSKLQDLRMKRIRLKPASKEPPIFFKKNQNETGGSLEREPAQH